MQIGKEIVLNALIAVRKFNMTLFASFDFNALQNRSFVSGSEISIGAFAFIVFGHARSHRSILENRHLILVI